jgi:hypothetical protein
MLGGLETIRKNFWIMAAAIVAFQLYWARSLHQGQMQ